MLVAELAGSSAAEEPSAVVLTPIYRPQLDDVERSLVTLSLNATAYAHVFLAPKGLDTYFYRRGFPEVEIRYVEPWFLSGVRPYNYWLTSAGFYEPWKHWKWILLCQTDAVLLRDPFARIPRESVTWDYLGAPWEPPIKVLTLGPRILVRSGTGAHRGPAWVGVVGSRIEVGNGGLSLRRVDAFARSAQEIEGFLSRSVREHTHEDVIWATYGTRKGVTVASPEVAASTFLELSEEQRRANLQQLPDVAGFHGVTHWPPSMRALMLDSARIDDHPVSSQE